MFSWSEKGVNACDTNLTMCLNHLHHCTGCYFQFVQASLIRPTYQLGVRKESEMGLILLSGDENMCIVDTDSKIQEGECWKLIKIHLSLT